MIANANFIFLLALGIMSWFILCYINILNNHIRDQNQLVKTEEIIYSLANNTVTEKCVVSIDSVFTLIKFLSFCIITFFCNKIVEKIINGCKMAILLKQAMRSRIIENKDAYQQIDNNDYFDGISTSSFESLSMLEESAADAMSFKSNNSTESIYSNFDKNQDIEHVNVNVGLNVNNKLGNTDNNTIIDDDINETETLSTFNSDKLNVWKKVVHYKSPITLSSFPSSSIISVNLMERYRICSPQRNKNVTDLYHQSIFSNCILDTEDDHAQNLNQDINIDY